MLGYRVLGLDYSFLRGALSPPTTHPGGLTQSASVLTLEDPQPPFKPGDPSHTGGGRKILRVVAALKLVGPVRSHSPHGQKHPPPCRTKQQVNNDKRYPTRLPVSSS